jgi:hypothetical protein
MRITLAGVPSGSRTTTNVLFAAWYQPQAEDVQV